MSLDLTTIAPGARAAYIKLGRQWSSSDTLDQAEQTLKGVAAHGAAIAKHGFSADDGARLKEARDQLVAAGGSRIDAQGQKKITNADHAKAITTGKVAREGARTILDNTKRALKDTGGPAAEAAVTLVQTALSQTRSAGDDATKLADQLDTLHGTLSDATVAAEAASRGGPDAAVELQAASASLRAAVTAHAGSPGTPVETERLDLLDGIIVTLARGARKAARAAARRLGQPSLTADFDLDKLYKSSAKPTTPATPANPAVPATPGGTP